jgi:alpha-1,6-mannosyltransferase
LRPLAKRTLAAASLTLMVVAGFLMAAGTAARDYGPKLDLPGSIRGPLQTLDLAISGTEFVVLCAVLGGCYLLVLALAGSISVRAGLATIAALHLIMALAPPLLSSDVFNYLGYARLEVVHDLNPYVYPLAEEADDPTYQFIGWPLQTSAYGPLFTLATLPLALLGLTASLWAFKAVVAAASLGCVALVWKCAERLGRDPLPAALFFGLNPIVLVFTVGGAHNDVLMMLAALAGIYVLLAGREAGVAGIVVAAGVKLSAAIVLPFALLGSRRPTRAVAWALGSAAVVAALSLSVFGPDVVSLVDVLREDSVLATPNDVPGVVNDLLGLGLSTEALSRIGMLVLGPVLAVLLVRVHRGADWLESAGWATLALLATTTWLLPWYLVWFLPLAALAHRPHQRIAALALTALILGFQLPPLAGR